MQTSLYIVLALGLRYPASLFRPRPGAFGNLLTDLRAGFVNRPDCTVGHQKNLHGGTNYHSLDFSMTQSERVTAAPCSDGTRRAITERATFIRDFSILR
jgi:hypothetical protein